MQESIRAAVAFARKMDAPQKQGWFTKKDQTMRRCSPLLPLAALATLCLSAPLRAGDQVPFKGYFIPIVRSSTPVDDTHVRLEFDVHVQATQLGKAQGPAFATLDLTDFSYVGGATWAAPNGDAVSFTFAGQFIPTSTPGVLENVETFEVIGGTGRFEGATGGGIAGGLLDANTFLPLGKGAPFVGSISSPGSLKKRTRL